MAFGTYLNEESDLACGITTLAPKFHKPELSFVFMIGELMQLI